jgi:putative CocE/NonD family hydrolase
MALMATAGCSPSAVPLPDPVVPPSTPPTPPCACGTDSVCAVSDGGHTECAREAKLKVKMRDQVGLDTHVFLPEGAGPFPTVLLRSPYLGINGDHVFLPFLRDGYALVAQSCRGTGESEGVLDPLVQEFDDGRDTVRWLAEQPWSNGKLATIGGSYEGFTAVAAALDTDKVKLVIADGAIGDAFTGWPMQRGMNREGGVLWWMAIVRGDPDPWEDSAYLDRVTNARPLSDLDVSYFGTTNDVWKRFAREMDADSAFWRERSLVGQMHRLCAPAIHIQANLEWEDDPYQIYADAKRNACESARNRQVFVKSDLGHAATAYGIFLDRERYTSKLIHEALARYLKDVDTPAPASFVAFVQGKNDWLSASDWPVNSTASAYHLASGSEPGSGVLAGAPAAAGQGVLSYDPDTVDPCTDAFDALYYLTEPLAENRDILGNIELELDVATDVPDGDLFVTVGSVDDAQNFNHFSGTSIRMRFRDGYSTPKPMVPGERAHLRIVLPSVTVRANRGERLWLNISPAQCGMSENPQTGGPVMTEIASRRGKTTVYTGGRSASVLRVPFVP